MSKPGTLRNKIRGQMFKLPLMLTCRQVEDFLLDYVEGTLPRGQRLIFDLHLAMCRECRDYLAAYRKTVELGKAAFPQPDAPLPDGVPGEVPEDLVQAILATKRGQTPTNR